MCSFCALFIVLSFLVSLFVLGVGDGDPPTRSTYTDDVANGKDEISYFSLIP